MLHFFVFQTLSVTNLTLSSNDMTYGICTWMQAIVSNHLKQKRKFMLKIHTSAATFLSAFISLLIQGLNSENCKLVPKF